MLGGVPLCTAVFLCVRRCSSVYGSDPLCTVVILCVRRWSPVFCEVQSSFRFVLPRLFTAEHSRTIDYNSHQIKRRKLERPTGVTRYNMRRRIVTFISCVHLSRVRGISFTDSVSMDFCSQFIFGMKVVCTNASKINKFSRIT